nr:hypothetical protein [Tanacetum cinerariifolium]
IIKEQVKEQVKAQVSKILPKIEKTVYEQLEAEVLTRSSNSSMTSYTVAANLSELELKKILIEKMESNKSKRRRAGKEPESTSASKEKTSKTTGKSTEGSKSHHKSASESVPTKEPMHTIKDLEEPTHQEFDTESISAPKEKTSKTTEGSKSHHKSASKSATADEPMYTTKDLEEPAHQEFDIAFVMNRLKVDTLTPELLASPTYKLMKGSCKSLVELEFFLEEVYKATTDQLDWNNPEG